MARGMVSGAPFRAGGASRVGDGCAAHDIGFDHDVARAADHQQMLDVVAADDDELAPAVDGGGIDHGEARLAAARGGIDPRRAEPAHQPGGRADQQQNEDECDDEVHRSR